jgi:hypothetical protein
MTRPVLPQIKPDMTAGVAKSATTAYAPRCSNPTSTMDETPTREMVQQVIAALRLTGAE